MGTLTGMPWPWPSVIRDTLTQRKQHRHQPEPFRGAAVAVPLDLPAVAVAVSDPGQLHPGDRQQDRAGTVPGAAAAVPLIFPPGPWSSVIRSSSTQGTDLATAPEPFRGGAVAVPPSCPEESGILSLDAGFDLQEHDGKAQPWQRDGFPDSR